MLIISKLSSKLYKAFTPSCDQMSDIEHFRLYQKSKMAKTLNPILLGYLLFFINALKLVRHCLYNLRGMDKHYRSLRKYSPQPSKDDFSSKHVVKLSLSWLSDTSTT